MTAKSKWWLPDGQRKLTWDPGTRLTWDPAIRRAQAAALKLSGPTTAQHMKPPLEFKVFFEECAPRVHRWITGRCDRDLADDLVQEVFLQALRRWEKLQYYDNPHAWVFLVARQMLWRYQRRVSEQAVELTEFRDLRIGDVDGLIDFGHALEELPAMQRKVAILVLALEYTPLKPHGC